MIINLIDPASTKSSVASVRGNGRLRLMQRERNQLLLFHGPVITHRHSLLALNAIQLSKNGMFL